MNGVSLTKVSAYLLFATTLATIAVMWQPAFWATALPEVAMFCLAAAWLVRYLLKRQRPELHLVLIPLIAAALWPMLQLAVGSTIYPWATSVAVLYWATGASIVFIGLQVFRDPASRRRYLRALVIAAFGIAIIAPLQLSTAHGKIFWLFQAKYSDVALGPFVYSNQYAAFIELTLPIALTLAFADGPGWRTFHGLAAVMLYASVFASGSRTGFILTTIEVLAVPLLAARRTGVPRRQLIMSGAVFLGMLIVLGLAVGPDYLFAKLQQKDPYFGRREYMESSLRMIPDKPLLGVGMGNWPAAYPAYAIFDKGFFANQAHNDWAQWAVEGGLPFFFLILSVAVWSSRMAFRSGWGIGLIAIFIQCFVDYPVQRMGVAIIFFSLVAAVAYPDERLKYPAGLR